MEAIIKLLEVLSGLAIIMVFFSFINPKKATFNKFPNWNRKKAAAAWFGIALVIGMISNAIMPADMKAEKEDKKINHQVQIEQSKFNNNILVKATALQTKEELEQMKNILNSVGITKVAEISHDETLDDTSNGIKGYRLRFGDTKNIIMYVNPNKTVQSIRYAGFNLYKDGQTLSNIENFNLSFEQESIMQRKTEKIVSDFLKSPSTAKFNSSDYKYVNMNGTATLSGTVDAQNSFGATLRSHFKSEFDTKNNMKLLHLTIDGEQVI